MRIERVSQAAHDPVPERFLHFHGPAELVLINEGSGRFLSETGGFAFSAGTVLYAPAMAIHDFAFGPRKRSWTLVQFDPRAIDGQIMAFPRMAAAAHLDPGALARVCLMLDWLGTCLDTQAPERETAIVLQALLLSLKGHFVHEPAIESGIRPQPSHFRPLLDHWVDIPHAALTLAEAASLCSLSPDYFSRQFKRAFGRGFIAYQTQIRLQQAARMIATTDDPVSLIGYRLGFHSPAYFSQCYKAVFGVAPSRHRNQVWRS